MRELWLLLGLGTLLQLLCTYGFDFKTPPAALLLLLSLVVPFGVERLPSLKAGLPLKVTALLAFHASLFFARRQVLLPFDHQDLLMAFLVAVTLVGSVWVLRSVAPRRVGGFTLAWLAGWQFSGLLDPVLPLLGLGVTTLLVAFGRWPEPEGEAVPAPFLPWFILGLVLFKPRWDYGLELAPALALGTFALGWLMARKAPLGRKLGKAGSLAVLGALGILYAPGVLWAWGLLAGLAWGWRQAQEGLEATPEPTLAPAAGGLLVGVGLSFALHANAWLPGLRHLIWLGS